MWNLEKTEISQAMLGRNPHMEILDMLQVHGGRPNSSLSGSRSRELDEGGVAGIWGCSQSQDNSSVKTAKHKPIFFKLFLARKYSRSRSRETHSVVNEEPLKNWKKIGGRLVSSAG